MAAAGGNKLTVLLLNEEGDRFNASSIAQGHQGGRAAADELHRIARAEVSSAGGGTGEAVVHLVTCAYAGSSSTKVAAQDQWLSGFGSSGQLCHLSLPLDDGRGAAGRILQLLTLYLPLASVSTIFLGSLHTDYLAPYLEGMPPRLRAKITLVETVTLAPGIKDLVDSGLLKMTSAFKGLFGEMAAADDVKVDWMGVEELEKQLAELEVEGDIPSFSSALEAVVNPAPAPPSPPRLATPEPPVVAPPPVVGAPPVVAAPRRTLTKEQAQAYLAKKAPSAAPPKRYHAPQKQDRFPVDDLPPYPTKAFRCRIFRFPPDQRPCNLYWLSPNGCPHAHCDYDHETPFSLEDFQQYRLYVKASPCPDMAKLGRCKYDDAECVLGHRCQHTLKDCPHVRKGACHYEKAGLPHSEPAAGGRW
ncbi:hypothetical protein JCM9279_002025 [Rhodotorula babjevae]